MYFLICSVIKNIILQLFVFCSDKMLLRNNQFIKFCINRNSFFSLFLNCAWVRKVVLFKTPRLFKSANAVQVMFPIISLFSPFTNKAIKTSSSSLSILSRTPSFRSSNRYKNTNAIEEKKKSNCNRSSCQQSDCYGYSWHKTITIWSVS